MPINMQVEYPKLQAQNTELSYKIMDLKEALSELINIGELEDLTFTDESATKLFKFWVERARKLIEP